ncbi:TfoX/Sxy family protein [Polaromonas sp. P2-4]|nr:TfoX/Sxy family protein [Polaromonas sp. P2-4]
MGQGEKLWLKADKDTRHLFEAAGCERFVYSVTQNGVKVAKSMNHYSAPRRNDGVTRTDGPLGAAGAGLRPEGAQARRQSIPESPSKTPQGGLDSSGGSTRPRPATRYSA